MTEFAMPEKWAHARADTPGAGRLAHFNNAGAALPPACVNAAIKTHLSLEAELGGYEAGRAVSNKLAEAYQSVGALVGADARNIAFASNATDAYARALSSIPFEPGDVIITAWSEYASNQIQLLSMAKRLGVGLVRAPRLENGEADLTALRSLIKEYRPKLVAAVHMNTSSGFIDNVEAIGAVVKDSGAYYLVDGCQTFGHMPINVGAIRCDFFSATSRKFLRGPRGAGILYVADRMLEAGLEPLFIDLRGAKLIDATRYEPTSDATRFEDWEFSIATLLGLGAAACYALNLGLSDIDQRLRELGSLLRAEIAALPGWRVLDRGQRLGAIIPIHKPGADGAAIQAALEARGVNTNFTPADWAPMDDALNKAGWAIRVSPHYYNDAADIDRLLQALKEAF